jgi:hypothetical protein
MAKEKQQKTEQQPTQQSGGVVSSLAVEKPKADKAPVCEDSVEVTYTEDGQPRTGKFKVVPPKLIWNDETLTAQQALARPEVMRALVEGTTVKGKSVFVQEIFE